MKINPDQNNPVYYFNLDKEKGVVAPQNNPLASEIDTNKDMFISDEELKSYLTEKKILKDPSKFATDEKQIVEDFKITLEGKPLPQKVAYHTYEQITEDMRVLAKKYPENCALISLGKTAEGRDIWALKISSGAQGDTSKKPGVVFTGLHHAREWVTAEEPLYLAKQLLENYNSNPDMKRRVDEAEIWVVPVVNPDGFVYSMEKDPWWRKNRRPLTSEDIPHKGGNIIAYGVDPNRNYWDGDPAHIELYRPKGDTPGSTWDDEGASDDPRSDDFRGPYGASEKEIQSLINFELKHNNIKGVIDLHSYGELLLYPWGHTYEGPENEAEYKELGKKMQAAMTTPYKLMQSANLYPTSGSSEDFHQINKRLTFTIEMGRSFQPKPDEIQKICSEVFKANMVFLDWILGKNKLQEASNSKNLDYLIAEPKN